MSAKGAKYMWRDGKIWHAARLWKAPTKRRVPRIHIEDRALEVGVIMTLQEPWMVFEETTTPVEKISEKGAISLEFYFKRFHLLPSEIDGIDTYDWMKEKGRALLLWGKGNHYFVRPQLLK